LAREPGGGLIDRSWYGFNIAIRAQIIGLASAFL